MKASQSLGGKAAIWHGYTALLGFGITRIKNQISAGAYTNDSEYIRDLIRRDQTNQADIEAIRAALIEGEESGAAKPFDANRFKAEMTAKYVSG